MAVEIRIEEIRHTKGEYVYYSVAGAGGLVGVNYHRDEISREESAGLIVLDGSRRGTSTAKVYAKGAGRKRIAFESGVDEGFFAKLSKSQISAIGRVPHDRLKEILQEGIEAAKKS